MYLSDKKAEKARPMTDHEELEVLLESFAKQVEEIVNEAETISVSVPAINRRGFHLRHTSEQCSIYAGDCGAYTRCK